MKLKRNSVDLFLSKMACNSITTCIIQRREMLEDQNCIKMTNNTMIVCLPKVSFSNCFVFLERINKTKLLIKDKKHLLYLLKPSKVITIFRSYTTHSKS